MCQPMFARVIRTASGGTDQLPYTVSDSQGNAWMIYQGGWCQMQNNNPVYSQGAMLMINGGQPNGRGNTARLDEKTGEIVFENMNCNGFLVTRHILIDKENNCVRYVDVIKNQQGADQNVAVQFMSNLNFGIRQRAEHSRPAA